MNGSNGVLTQFLLRYAPRLAPLRRIPVLGKILDWAGTKAVPRDSLVWVQVKEGLAAGLWLRINPRTGRHVLEGSGEPQVQRALAAQLRPGMVFYDLGANIGFFSLLAAKLVGEKGRVFSFEADPEVASRLRENIARNHFTRVSVEEKAVWSDSRRVVFARADPAQSPDRGLGCVTKAAAPNTVEVEAVSLDSYVHAFPAPDFIKCDVEGAEVEVFRGARELLRTKRPGVLCEVHNEENRRALVAEFSNASYVCAPCDENHILASPR